jgi:hypothetical protein
MPQPTGFYLPLSLPRRLMCDYLHFASKVPSVPVERPMRLGALLHARALAHPKPGWCSIFTKAWGFVCGRQPALRRAFLSFPWPRLYQHPISVASVAVERPYGDENAVFFCHINRPETKSLEEIDRRVRWFRDRPLGSSTVHRRQLRIARWPRSLRRALLWGALNVGGRRRARLLGTFGVTAYAGLGASSLHPIGLLTSTLSYGVIGADGSVDVRVIYDHRVLDGATVARALADLESVLTHEIVAELRYLEAVVDRAA